MSAACQASVEAFVSGAQQQVPALAQGLQPHQLQAFLCAMHAQCQGLHQSGHKATASVVEVRLSSSKQQQQQRGRITVALCHCLSPILTSPHLTSPHLTSPHLTSSHPTSPHHTPPHPTAFHPEALPLPSSYPFFTAQEMPCPHMLNLILELGALAPCPCTDSI